MEVWAVAWGRRVEKEIPPPKETGQAGWGFGQCRKRIRRRKREKVIFSVLELRKQAGLAVRVCKQLHWRNYKSSGLYLSYVSKGIGSPSMSLIGSHLHLASNCPFEDMGQGNLLPSWKGFCFSLRVWHVWIWRTYTMVCVWRSEDNLGASTFYLIDTGSLLLGDLEVFWGRVLL